MKPKMEPKVIRAIANPRSLSALERARASVRAAKRRDSYPHVLGIDSDGKVRMSLGGGWVGTMTKREYERMRRDISGKPYGKLSRGRRAA